MNANPENRKSVDQEAAARVERIWSRVLARSPLLAAQGAVVAGWRMVEGRLLGPYYRLAYREEGRQRSIYLGRSEELACRVRRLLDELRGPLRERRSSRRLSAAVRRSLRKARRGLRDELAARGVHLKGSEFRGVRRAFPPWSRPGRRPAGLLGNPAGIAASRGAACGVPHAAPGRGNQAALRRSACPVRPAEV